MSNKLLKKHIIERINLINDENSLVRIDKYVSSITPKPNINELLKLAGSISNEEADRMRKLVSEEFSKIEGEW